MQSAVRTVRIEERRIGERMVLAIDREDSRSFDFGERVYVLDDAGEERIGVVSWDPNARWVVAIEERSAHRAPW